MKIPKVIDVKAQDNYVLSLCFENGAKKVFDVKPLLDMQIYKPLLDQALFRNVSVDRFGGITWGNDMDCCRDTLYIESVPAQEEIAGTLLSAILLCCLLDTEPKRQSRKKGTLY